MTVRRRGVVVGLAALAAAIAVVAFPSAGGAGPAVASATLVDINGRQVGNALFRHGPDGALVATVSVAIDAAVAAANPSDFHGLHVHAGSAAGCVTHEPGTEPAPASRFTEVGGHWAEPGEAHGAHLGDLPSLLRRADGIATAEVTLDRADIDALVGRALVVHHLADDFGKHPGIGTSATAGNAGPRYACGVIQASARER